MTDEQRSAITGARKMRRIGYWFALSMFALATLLNVFTVLHPVLRPVYNDAGDVINGGSPLYLTIAIMLNAIFAFIVAAGESRFAATDAYTDTKIEELQFKRDFAKTALDKFKEHVAGGGFAVPVDMSDSEDEGSTH